MKEKLKYFYTSIFCFIGFFLVFSVKADAEITNGVQYHSKEDIIQYCKGHPVDMFKLSSYEIEPTDNNPGKLSNETIQDSLNCINQIRYITGLSNNVTLNEDYETKAQAGAFINYLNGKQSHTPVKPKSVSDELYKIGYAGTSNSNIWSCGSNKMSVNKSVYGFIADYGDSNIWLMGHRRWLFDPKLSEVGFGIVDGKKDFSQIALYCATQDQIKTAYYPIAWPAQNTPIEYFIPEADLYSEYTPVWTLSTGVFEDKNKVAVTLINENTGDTYHFSEDYQDDGYFHVNNDGCGEIGCIIFNPEIDKYNKNDTFKVEITGLKNGDITYTVNFFSLNDSYTQSELKNFLNIHVSPEYLRAWDDYMKVSFENIKYYNSKIKYTLSYRKQGSCKWNKVKKCDRYNYIYGLKSNTKYELKIQSYLKYKGIKYTSDPYILVQTTY